MVVAEHDQSAQVRDDELVSCLTSDGGRLTIVVTNSCSGVRLAELTRSTPDVFALTSFLDVRHHHRFLRYLVESRHPSVVIVAGAEGDRSVAPYLRTQIPELRSSLFELDAEQTDVAALVHRWRTMTEHAAKRSATWTSLRRLFVRRDQASRTAR